MELLGHMEILCFCFLRKPQSQEAPGEEGRDRVRRCWCCNGWGRGSRPARGSPIQAETGVTSGSHWGGSVCPPGAVHSLCSSCHPNPVAMTPVQLTHGRPGRWAWRDLGESQTRQIPNHLEKRPGLPRPTPPSLPRPTLCQQMTVPSAPAPALDSPMVPTFSPLASFLRPASCRCPGPPMG